MILNQIDNTSKLAGLLIVNEQGVMYDILGTTFIADEYGNVYSYIVALDANGNQVNILKTAENLAQYQQVPLPMSTDISYANPEIAFDAEYALGVTCEDDVLDFDSVGFNSNDGVFAVAEEWKEAA